MDRLAYLLLILIFFSCGNLKEVKKDGITYYFTENIPEKRYEVMCASISDEIKQSKFESLKNITTVKVDSVPFSIVLYIPYVDSITKETRDDFKAFANLLTHFDFDSIPVNLVLTDNEFKGRENIQYDKSSVTYDGTTMVRGRVLITSTPEAEKFSKYILDEILVNRMPELYKGEDSVKITVDMVRDTVMIDFNIDPKKNSVDTLRSQFIKTDKLLFSFTFSKKTILFHVRDKKNKELITVFGVRGE